MPVTKDNSNTILKKLVKHDMKCSRFYTFLLFLLPLILILFSCFFLQRDVIRLIANGKMTGEASFADYVFRFMEGMPVFVIGDTSSQFKIPAVWLVFHWWLSYIIGAYAVKDLHCQGANILLRVRSRKLWWLGKCIWAIVTVLLYYAFLLAVILLFTVWKGKQSLTLTPVLHGLPPAAAEALSGLPILAVGILVPVLISMGLTVMQLAITIWVNQIVGNVVLALVLMVSAYLCSPVLPGNYLMLLRSSSVIGSEGVTVGWGIGSAVLMLFIFIIAGIWRFQRYDMK